MRRESNYSSFQVVQLIEENVDLDCNDGSLRLSETLNKFSSTVLE